MCIRERYRCIVDFYTKNWEFVEDIIEIREKSDSKFEINFTLLDEEEPNRPSLIDKILGKKIDKYTLDTTTYYIDFTEDTCKSMKELLDRKQSMVEEFVQEIIDGCFHYDKIVNRYSSIRFRGSQLKLLPTAFTTDEDTYLLIVCGDKENDEYIVRTTDEYWNFDKKVRKR